MVDRQFLAARAAAETLRRMAPPVSPVFLIRARTGGVPGSVSAIPASTAITDQPSSARLHDARSEERLRLGRRAAAAGKERAWSSLDLCLMRGSVAVVEANERLPGGREPEVVDAVQPDVLADRVLRGLHVRVVERPATVVA